MKRRAMLLAVVFCGMLLTLGCSQQPPAAPDTRAADEAAIRKAETDMLAAAVAKQAAAVAGFYDPQGSALPANGSIATGAEAIGKLWQAMFDLPGFTIQWATTKVEVARSGDMAHSEGTYELQLDDAKGNPIIDKGKYVMVWKKQPDGSWKGLADIWNSDLPLGPPAK